MINRVLLLINMCEIFVGKYYLVDAGYAVGDGYLGPYRKKDRVGNNKKVKDNFNYHHASLRSVVERTFRVVKRRFEILKDMPSYPRILQSKIVLSCFALHNWLVDRTNEVEELMNPENIVHDYDGYTLDEFYMLAIRRWIAFSINNTN